MFLFFRKSNPVLPKRLHITWVSRDVRIFLPLAPTLLSFLNECWKTEKEDKVELRLHVTSTFSLEEIKKVIGTSFPQLLPRIHLGRPNWKFLFKQWREYYAG